MYKRDKQRINACSIAPSNMVGLVHIRRFKKKKEIEPFLIEEK